MSYQQGARTLARRRGRGLAARVSTPDDDDVYIRHGAEFSRRHGRESSAARCFTWNNATASQS